MGRTADAVVDRLKGLRWSCPKCKRKDIDFFKPCVQTKIGLAEAQKVLVIDKFSSRQEAFEDCTFVCSPHRILLCNRLLLVIRVVKIL